MVSAGAAAALTFVMGAVIFFCRAVPFFFFRGKDDRADETPDTETPEGGTSGGGQGAGARFLLLAEKTVPPVAMTALAFNAIAGQIKTDTSQTLPVLAASGLTALLHLWKRNVLLSIIAGTALYITLTRLV